MDILNKFNSQYKEYEENLTIIDKFKQCVNLYKNDTAIVDENGSLTYEEVDKISNNIAKNIIINNKCCSKIIAIDMKKSKEYIVTMLGVLKSGAAYMPLDEVYPKDRVSYMIENANVTLAITDDINRNNLNESITCFNYDDIKSFIDENNIELESYRNRNSNAYVMYTSGSTGRPKGIVITQKNLLSLVKHAQDNIFNNYNKRLNIAIVAPFVFDMSVADIYFSLFMGNSLYLVPNEDKKYGEGLVNFFKKYNIDCSDVAPTHLRFIADYLENTEEKSLDLSMIISIGEPLPLNLAKRIIKLANDENFQLINAYGPTECTVFVTTSIFNKKNINFVEKMHIGKPITNSKVYILDENKKPCNMYEEGELYISGDSVGKGYINREDITKKSFVEDIFDKDKIMYATGDAAKWIDDGNIEYIGRKDNQVKLYGHRIELEEIEKRIESYFGVMASKVIVDKSVSGFERIVSYVLTEKDINCDMILQDLRKSLPNYMIPKYIMKLDQFPINNSGKIDTKKLLTYQPKVCNINIDENFSATEKKVIEICSDVLVNYNIKLTDNFFALGGQSIDLLKVVLELNKYFKININISNIYKAHILKDFAVYIDTLREKSNYSISNIKKEDNTHVLVSQSQKVILDKEIKLLKSNIIHTEENGITLIYIINVNKYLDYNILKNAVEMVIQKHPILRTVFKREKNKFYMSEKEYDGRDVLDQIFLKENLNYSLKMDYKKYLKPIYMDKLPLIKIDLLEFKNKQQLLLNVHHGIIDFLSIGLLLKEIFTAYEDNKLDHMPTTYFDYIERNKIKDKSNILNFWKNTIKDRNGITEIKGDINGKEDFVYKIIQIPEKIQNDLRKAASIYKVSEYNILLSAFGLLLFKYTNRNDIIVGSYIPGRDYDYDSETLGMFTASVPIRMKYKENYIIKDYISSINEYIVQAFCNQDIDLWEIYRTMSFNEVMKGKMFNIFFNYEIMLNNYPCYKDYRVTIDTINLNPDITEKDIYLGIVKSSYNYRIEFKYNSGKYSEAMMNKFINTYLNILEIISKKCELTIKQIVKEC